MYEIILKLSSWRKWPNIPTCVYFVIVL